MLQQTLRSMFFLLVAFGMAVGVRATIWAGPILVYSMHRSSLRRECTNVRNGMTPSEVQKLFHKVKPFSEAMVGDGLRFEGEDACEVTLGSGTKKVVSAQFLEQTISGVE